MSTATKPKMSTPHPDTLPASIDVPPEVAELSRKAAAKLEYRQQALEARTAADQALEQAEADDAAATRKAVEAGKPVPKSCVPEREEQARAARRTLKVATEVAEEAIAELEASLTAHSKQLVSVQRERTEAATAKAEQHLADFEAALAHASTEAGLLYGLLHEPANNRALKDRTGGRRNAPKVRRQFKPIRLDPNGHTASLRANLQDIYKTQAGLRLLILEALEEAGRPLTTEQLAKATDEDPNDNYFRGTRDEMIHTGELEITDADGNRTNPASPYTPKAVYYRRGTSKKLGRR